MKYSDPLMITLFTIAAVSALCTLCVLMHLFVTHPVMDIRILLIFLLHATVLMEDISNLPIVYNGSNVICHFMGWLHYYTGFANILVVSFLSVHHFGYLNIESHSHLINRYIRKYSVYMIFGLPLITLLPFITNSYGLETEIWCVLPGNRTANTWAFFPLGGNFAYHSESPIDLFCIPNHEI
jgi:hypothetical protein